MRLTVNYFDSRNGHSETTQIVPNIGGTYLLPLLADHRPVELRLMPTNGGQQLPLTDRTFFLSLSSNTPLRLHVPHDWKAPHLTVALADTDATPKRLLFVLATAAAVSTEDVRRLIETTPADLPLLCGMLVHMDHYPNLPQVQAAPAKAA